MISFYITIVKYFFQENNTEGKTYVIVFEREMLERCDFLSKGFNGKVNRSNILRQSHLVLFIVLKLYNLS